MSEKKDIKIDWKNIWKKTKEYSKWILKKIKDFLKVLKKWKVLKSFGLLMVLTSGILIFIEFVALGLLHSKPEKFGEIFKYFFGLDFFNYVSLKDFYLITGGGYLIDLFFFLLLIFLGIWFWKEKNYFTERFVSILMAVLLGLGIVLFSFGFYRAMPKIFIPLERVEQFCKEKEYLERHKEDNWKIERRDFKNGFEERGYLRDRNLDAMYYNFFKSF